MILGIIFICIKNEKEIRTLPFFITFIRLNK